MAEKFYLAWDVLLILDLRRYVLAVNAIICVYSFVETWLAVWTYFKGTLLLPDTFQVWFDFGHDQVRK